MSGFTVWSDDNGTADIANVLLGAGGAVTTDFNDDTGGAADAVGMFYNDGTTNYRASITFLSFDTSAVLVTPGTVTLRLVPNDNAADPAIFAGYTAFDLMVAAYPVEAIDATDWQTPSDLAALTPVGSVNTVGMVADTPVDIDLDPSVINLGGITQLILWSSRQEAGADPNTGAGLRAEQVLLYGTDDATPANRPQLTTTESPPASPGDLPTLALSADLDGSTDLTPYGEEPAFNIQRGLTSPMTTGMVADAGTLSTLLDNISRDLDPDNASGPFAGFLRPKVATAATVTWGATTYDLLTGRVDGWPQSYPHTGTDQVVDFRATDLFLFLANTPINTTRPPEKTHERIEAVLASIDYPGPTSIEPGLSTVCGQNLQTVAALSHLGDVAQVEYGEFGIDASEVLYFRGRPAIATDARSTVVQAEYVQSGGLNFVDVTRGPLPLINHITLTFGRNGRQVTVRNQDSIDAYDLQAASISLPFETYSQARTYGKWLLFLYAQPRTEFTTVTFEPYNAPGDTFDLWADVLSRKEGDLIQITLDPLVAPYTLAGDPIVETCWIRGINYQFDQSPQRVSFTVQSAWIDGLFYWDTSELDGPDFYGL